MQFRPPGKSWLSWCRPATFLHQPRDKNVDQVSCVTSLLRVAPAPPSPHPPLTCAVTLFLFANQLASLAPSHRNYTIASEIQNHEPQTRTRSLLRVQKPAIRSTTKASQSLSSPGRDVDPSNQPSFQLPAQTDGEDRPSTWKVGIVHACN